MNKEVKKIEIERTARNLAILKSAYVDGHHEHAYNEKLGLIGLELLGCRGGEPLLKVQKLARTRFSKYSNAVVTYDDSSTVTVKASKAYEALDAVFSDPRSYENFGEKLALALQRG
jgi:hypothetical protein